MLEFVGIILIEKNEKMLLSLLVKVKIVLIVVFGNLFLLEVGR